jgi:hypothetical protein
MAWRVVQFGDERWTISPAAERRPDRQEWQLAFLFREAGQRARSLWATYPAASASKAQLFARAEHIPDDQLTALLSERLGQACP